MFIVYCFFSITWLWIKLLIGTDQLLARIATRSARCGLFLHMSGHSVVCVCVFRHEREPCENGWIDRGGVWRRDSGGHKKPWLTEMHIGAINKLNVSWNILPARRYANAGTAMALCLFVTISEIYSNGWTNRADFLARELPFTYRTLCYKEIRASPKIRILASWTLSQTPDLENSASACRWQRCGLPQLVWY